MPYGRKSTYRRKAPVARPRRRLQQNNRMVGPHGARGAGAVGALAAGVRIAYRNRGAIQEATRFVRRQFAGAKRQRTGDGVGLGSAYHGTNNVTHTLDTVNRSFGRAPRATAPRAMKLLNMALAHEIQRYQGVTNFDTNAGFFPLCQRGSIFTNGEYVKIPMNGVDLTSFTLNGAFPAHAHAAFHWNGLLGSSHFNRVSLQGQNASCDTGVTEWLKERSYNMSVEGNQSSYYTDAVQHEWTQMKLNLYGARHRTTTFYIDFVRFKDSKANFFEASNTFNVEARDALEYLTGGLMYSNLVKRESKGGRHLDVVKRLKYTVAAETSLDLNTSSGKIKNVNIFIRHGRVLRYDRDEAMTNGEPDFDPENPDLPHAHADGADWQENLHPNRTVHPRARLYCLIRAFAPTRAVNNESTWMASPNTPFPYISANFHSVIPTSSGTGNVNNEPSYDMIVRNKYSFVPKQQVVLRV